MYIKLKKITAELEVALKRGSDEQIISIYNLVKEYYDKLGVTPKRGRPKKIGED